MLLAIDVGNTQTVIGLYDDVDLLDHWRIATNAERTSDEHALLFAQFLEQHGFSFDDDITGIAVSSVVPRLTAALREMAERYFRFDPVVIEPGIKSGVPILYDSPREVGADRIANAVGTLDLYGGPAVVVDFGTATTFDCITADGHFLGGVIMPGIRTASDALIRGTAKLPATDLTPPARTIGRRTEEAIRSGVLLGTADAVDGIVRRIKAEWPNDKTPHVIATGGLASLVAALVHEIESVHPDLTLTGLRIAATALGLKW